MFINMKEDMAKQQAMFDRECEQAENDWENMARERKEMKYLNDQLLAQFTDL